MVEILLLPLYLIYAALMMGAISYAFVVVAFVVSWLLLQILEPLSSYCDAVIKMLKGAKR